MSELSTSDSAAIRVCRVICIFFMMSVHLVPGPANASFVTVGAFSFVGDVWIGYLGRASTASLSLISGFLLAGVIVKGRASAIVASRARTLIAPMVTWNLITILAITAASVAGLMLNDRTLTAVSSPTALMNGIFGITGNTANLSLFFLRDLFASSVLILLCWPIIRRFPIGALAFALFLAVDGEVAAPLVFRPTILLFMLAGCVLRNRSTALTSLVQPRVALPALLVSVAVLMGCNQIELLSIPSGDVERMIGNCGNIAKRIALVFVVLSVAVVVGKYAIQRTFDRLEPVAYLAYLSHAFLAKMIWIAFALAGAQLIAPSYLLYFVFAPAIVFGLAYYASPLVQRLPAPIAILVSGKAKRPRPAIRQGGDVPARSAPVEVLDGPSLCRKPHTEA